MRVAVVGAGVFGCTIAVDLARAGAQVDLYESRYDILDGATSRNQARLHRGYHYPRSDATAAATRDAFDEFAYRYPTAIRHARHYYAVAPGSKTGPADYLAFMDRLDLPYEVLSGSAGSLVKPPHIHTADLAVRVPEAFVDTNILRRVLRGDLARAGVQLHLHQRVEPDDLDHDLIVRASYGQPWSTPLRYELCEVAVLELGRYSDESYVVVDGDYVSLDPHGRFYTLYDVVHSVHQVNVGHAPEIPDEYAPLLDRYLARSPLSRFDAMVDSASRFLWGLDPGGQGVSIYHGSLWSVRAVLPDVDGTDERPTLIERDGNVVSVLSGKICTAVAAARAVAVQLVPA